MNILTTEDIERSETGIHFGDGPEGYCVVHDGKTDELTTSKAGLLYIARLKVYIGVCYGCFNEFYEEEREARRKRGW
jgi:hypothetical protein